MPTLKDLLDKEGGKIYFLLGNESAARAFVESAGKFLSGYPGTPSSETLNILVSIHNKFKSESGILHAEYSTNEAVAAGAAIAAAHSNARSLSTMKMVGLNVASDSYSSAAIFPKMKGGSVIYVGDDPNCYSSQNQLDTRRILKNMFIPILEPSNPNETKRFVIEAFALSHKYQQICAVRTTTRVAHQRGDVNFGPVPSNKIKEAYGEDLDKIHFEYDPEDKPIALSSLSRKNYPYIFKRMEKIQEFTENEAFEQSINKIIKGEKPYKRIGIITSGVSFDHVKEACHLLGIEPNILKLGITNPLPIEKIKEFAKKLKKLIVVEELEPFLEEQIRGMLKGFKVDVFGKDPFVYNGEVYFPRSGELTPGEIVAKSLSEILNKGYDFKKYDINIETPKRKPKFCPGCPHTGTFYIINKVFKRKDTIYSQDIGCYTLGIKDIKTRMGGSIDAVPGFSPLIKDKDVVAIIGDSTFLHAGIPGLINTVFNKHKGLLVICDNGEAAMTGHQPRAITSSGDSKQQKDKTLEDIVKGCGVKNVYTIDPYKVDKDTINIMKVAKEKSKEEITVVISQRRCMQSVLRDKRKKEEPIQKYTINLEKCVDCSVCYDKFGCSAIFKEEEHPEIDVYKCAGCGVCEDLCKAGAIEKIMGGGEND